MLTKKGFILLVNTIYQCNIYIIEIRIYLNYDWLLYVNLGVQIFMYK